MFSFRCLMDLACKAVQYHNNVQNCILIHGIASRENTTFVFTKQTQLFRGWSHWFQLSKMHWFWAVCFKFTAVIGIPFLDTALMFTVSELWSRPPSWTSGDLPAPYLSFDSHKYKWKMELRLLQARWVKIFLYWNRTWRILNGKTSTKHSILLSIYFLSAKLNVDYCVGKGKQLSTSSIFNKVYIA